MEDRGAPPPSFVLMLSYLLPPSRFPYCMIREEEEAGTRTVAQHQHRQRVEWSGGEGHPTLHMFK